MGRQAGNSVVLKSGERVGYSLTKRDGWLRVRFVDPTGRRVERKTGCERVGEARAAAEFIIQSAYAPPGESAPAATWDDSLADLERTPDLRFDSIRNYKIAVNALRKFSLGLPGPDAVTLAVASRFPAKAMSESYRRGGASDAATYKRSPTTVNTYLRSLRSLWSKHWRPKGYAATNPWKEVPYLNAPRGKRVRVPSEEAIKAFFAWLAAKHPGWELPRLFVTVKMLAGCRTADLCHAKTADLKSDSLTLAAESTKTREARTVPLPADVVAELREHAGPVYLWGRAADESRRHRGGTRDAHASGFRPDGWKHTIENLFREFNRGRLPADRLRPHDLRGRAITLVAAATQSVDATAQAMGVDAQTARH